MISEPGWTNPDVGNKAIHLGKAYDMFIEPIKPNVPAKDDDVGYGHFNTYLTITKVLLLESLLEDRPITQVLPVQAFTLSSMNCLAKLCRKSPFCGEEKGEDHKLARDLVRATSRGLQLAIYNSESLPYIARKTVDIINEQTEMNLTPDEKTEFEMALKCHLLHEAITVGIITQFEKKAVIFDGTKEEEQKKWYDLLEGLSKEHGYPGPMQVKQSLQSTMKALPKADIIQL